MSILIDVVCGWVAGLTVGMLGLVAMGRATPEEEKALNLMALAIWLGACVGLAIMLALWWVTT